MIRFDVNEKGYSVEWTNLPYDMLYMVYYPIGRSKKIVGGRIVFQPEKQVPEFVVCPNQYGTRTGLHSQHIPNGSYSIRLCTNSLGENCEILAEKTVYLGHKVTVKYGLSGTVGKNDPVARFEVWSDCYIPREHIWLAYKAVTGDGADGSIDLGIRVFLPKMIPARNMKFYTECLMPQNGYRFSVVELSEDISDCIRIERY